MPISSTATFAQIAEATGLTEQDVTHILRHAFTDRIFYEPEPGIVGHTAASRLLASSPELCNFILIAFNELLPSAVQMAKAMERWPGSNQPNHAGFNIAHNTTDPMFTVFDKDPERAARFASSMSGFSDLPYYSPLYLINGYDWSSARKVVDVGGGDGRIARELVEHFDELQVIVQDLPRTIDGAAPPSTNRIALSAHDFFQE